ncbi:MAG: hypothetical protein ACC630_08575 [Nitrospinota bacterium]
MSKRKMNNLQRICIFNVFRNRMGGTVTISGRFCFCFLVISPSVTTGMTPGIVRCVYCPALKAAAERNDQTKY